MGRPPEVSTAVPRKSLHHLRDRARALGQEAHALYLAYRDPRVPLHARLFAACVAGYALSPVDLIPDPIPILGYLDDLVLVPIGVALAIRLIPNEVLAECRERARSTRPPASNRVAAVAVIFLWVATVVALALLIQALL